MSFNSYSYLLLLVPAVAAFWALPDRARKPYLIAASVVFYATWNPWNVWVPLAVCAVVLVCTRGMASEPSRSRTWCVLGIGFTLLLLIIFKYRQFVLDNLGSALSAMGRSPTGASVAIALPLGISFYSFEAIGYLIDMRQGRGTRLGWSDLVLFVMFWPHLLAGPIVRARELAPQFGFHRKFDVAMLVGGMDRIVWGLVQKNVFANSLGPFVDEGFLPKAAQLNSAVDNWFLAVAFGLQIYLDFSAYSNIAIGTAQLLGITLPENFRFPYHAKSPSDFWSRWHMTLSRWVRDYLFFPLSARHRDPIALYLSLVGVMAVVGLWHGAGWGFVAWGLMHGMYLVLQHSWERIQGPRWPRLSDAWSMQLAGRALTLTGAVLAWVPFRATTGVQTRQLLSTMLFGFSVRVSYSANFYLMTALIALFCAAEPHVIRLLSRMQTAIQDRFSPFCVYGIRPLAYAAGLLFFMIFDDQASSFIYFQF